MITKNLYAQEVFDVLSGKKTLPKIEKIRRDLYKEIPKKYLRPNEFLSWLNFIKHILIYLACVIPIIFLWGSVAGYFLIPIFCFFAGVSIGSLFNVAHDCIHSSFSRFPWINTILGNLLISWFGYNFFAFRKLHAKHHALNQGESDPVYEDYFGKTKLSPNKQQKNRYFNSFKNLIKTEEIINKRFSYIEKIIMFIIHSVSFCFYKTMVAEDSVFKNIYSRKIISKKERIISIFSFFVMMSISAILILYFGAFIFLTILVIPLIIAGGFLYFSGALHVNDMSIMPCNFNDESLTDLNIMNIETHKSIEFIASNSSFARHVEHHVLVGVPSYYLKYVSPYIMKKYESQIRPPVFLTLSDALKSFFLKDVVAHFVTAKIGDKEFVVCDKFLSYLDEDSRKQVQILARQQDNLGLSS